MLDKVNESLCYTGIITYWIAVNGLQDIIYEMFMFLSGLPLLFKEMIYLTEKNAQTLQTILLSVYISGNAGLVLMLLVNTILSCHYVSKMF